MFRRVFKQFETEGEPLLSSLSSQNVGAGSARTHFRPDRNSTIATKNAIVNANYPDPFYFFFSVGRMSGKLHPTLAAAKGISNLKKMQTAVIRFSSG